MSRFALRVARDTNCRRHRQINGTLRCEERRSNAIGGVIVLDVAVS